MFFLNLSYLQDEFFGTEENDKKFYTWQNHFVLPRKSITLLFVCENKHSKQLQHIKHLQIPWNEKPCECFLSNIILTACLKYSKLDLPNLNSFWHMIKCFSLPYSNDVFVNSNRVIPHNATMLLTNSGKNG